MERVEDFACTVSNKRSTMKWRPWIAGRLDKVLLYRLALFCVEVPQNTRESVADKVTKESFIEKKNKELAKIAMPDSHATAVGYKLIINCLAMTSSSFSPQSG